MKQPLESKSLLREFSFRNALPYVILTLGIVLYICGIGEFINLNKDVANNTLNEILKALGNLFVVGSIIGFFTSYLQDKKIYQKNLEEIIYNDEFLSKRTDIKKIWTVASKALFNSKFPEITNDLLTLISDKYFPVNNISYYENLIISIKINWEDELKKRIISEETHSFFLITESKDTSVLTMSCWIHEDTEAKIINCKVNNKDIDVDGENIKKTKEETKPNNTKHYEHAIEVCGQTRYEIKYTREKKWNFENDTDNCYRAKYIVNNLSVHFQYPADDFNVKLICRGTINDFEEVASSPGFLIYRYNGLVLPRQGYVITLNKKS